MSRVVALVSKTKSKHLYNDINIISRNNTTGPTGKGGNTGNTGPTGGKIVGPIGINGSHGASGEKGMTGLMAIVGDIGHSGITGYKGPQGPHLYFLGSTGRLGDSGYTGSKGSNDNQGMLGATGATGAVSYTGTYGITGFTGEYGFEGDDGFTGSTGGSGDSGITGFTGPIGFSGNNGRSGATGATGIIGINGDDGFTGVGGVNGLIGAYGFTGPTGQTGHIGGGGPTGNNGLEGFTGNTGFTGLPAGIAPGGLVGVSGPTGGSINGYTGMTGPIGYTGPRDDSYASQITNLQTLTSKLYKTNDTLVLQGDYIDRGTLMTFTPRKIGNKTLNYPVPSNGTLFGTSNPGANMMCSRDGIYVSLCASGCVFVSNNYGNTFTLKSFDSVLHAISVSATGKYQCCVSTGVPKACIIVSSDFGVTWTETLVTGSAYDKWLSSVSISPSGKYIYCSGGGGSVMTNWSSTNFGLTFTSGGNSLIKTSASVNDAGKVISITSGGRYVITDLSSGVSELARGTLSSTVGEYFVSMNQESPGYVSVGPAGLVHNPLPAGSVLSLTTRTTPEVFQQAQIIIGEKIWARSINAIYTSTDLGVSWVKIYFSPIPIRTMHIAPDSRFLYILLNDGDVIRTTIYLPPTRIVGFKSFFKDPTQYSLLSFGLIGRPVFLGVPIGKWLITYGFKMGSTDSTGDCVNSNIRHGIGGTTVGNEFVYTSNYSKYGITFGDSSTYQVFSNNFIMNFSSVTQIEVQINLLNSPVNGNTSVFVYDTFLERKFISM